MLKPRKGKLPPNWLVEDEDTSKDDFFYGLAIIGLVAVLGLAGWGVYTAYQGLHFY